MTFWFYNSDLLNTKIRQYCILIERTIYFAKSSSLDLLSEKSKLVSLSPVNVIKRV